MSYFKGDDNARFEDHICSETFTHYKIFRRWATFNPELISAIEAIGGKCHTDDKEKQKYCRIQYEFCKTYGSFVRLNDDRNSSWFVSGTPLIYVSQADIPIVLNEGIIESRLIYHFAQLKSQKEAQEKYWEVRHSFESDIQTFLLEIFDIKTKVSLSGYKDHYNLEVKVKLDGYVKDPILKFKPLGTSLCENLKSEIGNELQLWRKCHQIRLNNYNSVLRRGDRQKFLSIAKEKNWF